MRFKFAFLSFVLWVLLGSSVICASVIFSDPKLESAVLVELGRSSGTVSEAELAGLTQLDAAFHGITDLTGLEGAASLASLNLFGNFITDLTPLTGLTTVEDLDLGANNIADLSPIDSLTNLTWLRLDLNPLEDLSPLSGMVQMQHLFLNGTGLDSLGPLSAMGQLVYLSAANNRVSDASILSSACPLLEELNLSGNQLTSATFISGLGNLTSIDLQNNFINEIGWPSGSLVAPVSAGQWHHVALVIDGGINIQPDSLKVYFEGSLLGSTSGSQLWSHGADIGIGAMVYQTRFPDTQPDGDGYYFQGRIDDVRIYHRALSGLEISSLASGSGPVDTAVWWPFDGNALDVSGSNDGTTAGNAGFDNGVYGQSLMLDGAGDSVSVPDSADINLRTCSQYTVSLFFRADNPNAGRQILYEQGGRTRGLNLYVEDGNFIAGAWNDIPEESAWAGAWIGEATAGPITRLNLSGNQLDSLPVPPTVNNSPDWDVSHNRLFDLDNFAGLTGSGTLRIEGNFFDPAASVTVATLVAAGMDVLGEYPSSYTDYQTWRSVHFLPIDALDDLVSGPWVDPDLDGLVNLLECAFGGDPLSPDGPSVAPWQVMDGDVMEYGYRDLCPEIQLQVQESTTMESGTWAPATGTLDRNPCISGWRFQKLLPVDESIFLRIEGLLP
jgi:hypothetical protein